MVVKNIKPFEPYSWQTHCYNNLTTYNAISKDRQDGKSEFGAEVAFSIIHSPKIKNPNIAIVSDEIARCYRIYADKFNKHFQNNRHFDWKKETQSNFSIPRKEGDKINIDILGTKHNFFGLKGGSYHYVLIDEYGLIGEGYFEEVASPTIRATKGIIIVTGTVEDNWWYDLYHKALKKYEEGDPHWFAFQSHWGDEWSRRDHTKKELEMVKAPFDMSIPEDARKWDKEYLCNWFAASSGKIFSKECDFLNKNGSIGSFPYNPKYKVGFAIDNGRTTAIWFYQFVKGSLHIIDYKEVIECGFSDIAKLVGMWYSENKAELDIILLPHTMGHRHQSAEMLSNQQVFFNKLKKYFGEDLDCVMIPKVSNIELKIEALRRLLLHAKFNKDTTYTGLRSIRNYKRQTIKTKGYISSKEDKQWTHGVDALGELALALDNNVFDNSLDRVITKPPVKSMEREIHFLEKLEKLSKRKIGSKKRYLGGY